MGLDKETLKAVQDNKWAIAFLYMGYIIWMLWGELQKEKQKNEIYVKSQLQEVTSDRNFWRDFARYQQAGRAFPPVYDTIYVPVPDTIRPQYRR